MRETASKQRELVQNTVVHNCTMDDRVRVPVQNTTMDVRKKVRRKMVEAVTRRAATCEGEEASARKRQGVRHQKQGPQQTRERKGCKWQKRVEPTTVSKCEARPAASRQTNNKDTSSFRSDGQHNDYEVRTAQ